MLMKSLPIFSLAILLVLNSFSQVYINQSKEKVRKDLQAYEKKNNLKTVIEETDSTLTLLVRDSSKRPLDAIMHFDKDGKCNKETIVSNCDSCISKYTKPILAKRKYHWKAVNSVRYLSSYSRKLFLEMDHPDTPHSYSISRFAFSKKEYNEMLAGKECCTEKK
jgi:hypothetical protein